MTFALLYSLDKLTLVGKSLSQFAHLSWQISQKKHVVGMMSTDRIILASNYESIQSSEIKRVESNAHCFHLSHILATRYMMPSFLFNHLQAQGVF